jgi:hypothetical protein
MYRLYPAAPGRLHQPHVAPCIGLGLVFCPHSILVGPGWVRKPEWKGLSCHWGFSGNPTQESSESWHFLLPPCFWSSPYPLIKECGGRVVPGLCPCPLHIQQKFLVGGLLVTRLDFRTSFFSRFEL